MGWGIIFEDYLSRITINELDIKKEETEEYIRHLEFTMLALLASSPHEVRDVEGNTYEWIDYISGKAKELLEEFKEQTILLHKINICIEDNENIKQD